MERIKPGHQTGGGTGRWLRLLVVALGLLVAVASPVTALGNATLSSPSGLAQLAAEDPEDIPACDADDPDFGTGCEEQGEGDEESELRDGYLDSRQIPGDTITTGDLELAAQQAALITPELRGLVDPNWHLVGPSNVGGRVSDIAPDPTQAGTVYVTVSTAGVWKSVDGGVTMTKAWPDDFPQSVGAVTVAPNGDVWVGTGEVNPGGGSLSYSGNGLYRSSDGGATWALVGLEGSSTIGAIRFNPGRPRHLVRGIGWFALRARRHSRPLQVDRLRNHLRARPGRPERLHRRDRYRDGSDRPRKAVRPDVGPPS
jgi:hypothetical protein